MTLRTHQEVDEELCGRLIYLEDGEARVWLHTSQRMRADEYGLIHGGFLFGAADYAAMAVVNDPNVVLATAQIKFLAPVRKGKSVLFIAKLEASKGKRQRVKVIGELEGRRVFEGSFDAFVLSRHVLEP